MRGEHRPARQSPRNAGTIPACAGSTRPPARLSTPRRDHPRVRGEHPESRDSATRIRGPSPRARGAPRNRVVRHGRPGTIPACAGSTCRRTATPSCSWDHPRVRGEHPHWLGPGYLHPGPSPRARGAHHARVGEDLRKGTIPACAGSTTDCCEASRRLWDHPRVRGEHTEAVRLHLLDLGPSARARGAQHGPGDLRDLGGTIPACAGSTGPAGRRSTAPGDHPRVRGEHVRLSYADGVMTGPSPRARGALLSTHRGVRVAGTIPACAGSTGPPSLIRCPSRDHPRVRGEHALVAMVTAQSVGPSPRARGAHAPRHPRLTQPGTIPACAGSTQSKIRSQPSTADHPRLRGGALAHGVAMVAPIGTIPACAGSTAKSPRTSPIPRDHPRVRGERLKKLLSESLSQGPSPRARGALPSRHMAVRTAGTIPACAGSTR